MSDLINGQSQSQQIAKQQKQQTKKLFPVFQHALKTRFIDQNQIKIKKQKPATFAIDFDLTSIQFSRNISLRFQICIQHKTTKIKCCIGKNNRLDFINSRYLRKIIISYTSRILHRTNPWEPFCLVNMKNGLIYIKFPKFNQKQMFCNTNFLIKYIEFVLLSFKQNLMINLKKIFELSNKLLQNQYTSDNKKYSNRQVGSKRDHLLQPILKHMVMVHSWLTVSKSIQNDFDLIDEEQVKNINSNICPIQFLSQIRLYAFHLNHVMGQNSYNYYKFTMQDSMIFKPIVAVPKPRIQQFQKFGENRFLFNYIKIDNPQSVRVQAFKQGGFSNLQLAKLRFHYVEKNEEEKEEENNEKEIKYLIKWILIKLPKSQSEQKSIKRQTEIIKLLKNANSGYMFKYYVSEQSEFRFSNRLMIDATSDPNLHEYINLKKQTLSLKKILVFLSQIAQSLRFLKDYNIVHMDLKPNNIMLIIKQLLIKIVDFGEAYNKYVCKQQYSPGFTIPYASPQIFTNQTKQFTHKQDIFSFGIMAYEMLFNRFPFQINKIRNVYKSKRYLQKMYIVPEQLLEYGDKNIMKILLRLILKCIDPQQLKRPVPIWLVIILKQIINYCNQCW